MLNRKRGQWRTWGWKDWAWEFGVKQPVDQALHFVWGLVPWWLCAEVATGLYSGPHQVISGLAGIGAGLIAGISTLVFVLREVNQWPSSRPWDPYLDWLVFGVGCGVGIWLGLR